MVLIIFLQREYRILMERSRTVTEREKSLQQAHKMFDANVEAETLKRMDAREKVCCQINENLFSDHYQY